MSTSGTKFQKRDLQRLRKVYPGLRKTPRMVTISDKEMNVETARLNFTEDSGTTQVTYNFQLEYTAVPTVSVSVTDGAVLARITAITTSYVTVDVSGPFDGSIGLQIIHVGD